MSKPREDRPLTIGDVSLEDAYGFLDNLRESGVTNMYGAKPYLLEFFEISKQEASEILGFWMSDFSKEEDNGAGRN